MNSIRIASSSTIGQKWFLCCILLAFINCALYVVVYGHGHPIKHIQWATPLLDTLLVVITGPSYLLICILDLLNMQQAGQLLHSEAPIIQWPILWVVGRVGLFFNGYCPRTPLPALILLFCGICGTIVLALNALTSR